VSRDETPRSRSDGPNPTTPPRVRTPASRRVEGEEGEGHAHEAPPVEALRMGARPPDATEIQLPRWALIAIVVIFITLAIGGFIFLLGYIGSLTASM
jgi:hypothetical protein